MAAALNEDQEPEPEPDEPLGWQLIWMRPRKLKSKAVNRQELGKQRRRFQNAGRRRPLPGGHAGLARGRSGSANAAARRDARRAVPVAALPCLAVVAMPDTVRWVDSTVVRAG
ncbi:predicted protein [Streptomyces sviceus ATCC 29083]|uniref:Uncharacterized protein n=1 Tax=Streptomyces sviceus (strain ATCC 29083 / DSM 924 / JCM 4929 / NBRC 13980 / NCIMB 11184 / NRRL 5439 / UC 5370) TaxID=463191 RepID=B5HUX3_STRX2|nr:predicted protein [Streptomyces sviceus ATCC 29083]